MKKLILCLLLLAVCVAGVLAQANNKLRKSELPAGIANINDGDSLGLLNEPAIKARMEKLLGRSYEAFLASFETVTPVEKKGAFLFSSGCIIHGCGSAESAIAIDLDNNTIHAAIYDRSKRTGYFNERGRKTPKVIKDWAKRLAAQKK
jgi:hypothetical protein